MSMKPFRYVGTDEPLSTEQGLFIRQQVVQGIRRNLVARKLLPIRKIDAGAQTFGYDVLTEVSAAAIDQGWPGKLNEDIINLARTTVDIPNIHKEFTINKLDLLSSQMTGTPLNTVSAESAGYKVGLLEDAMLINGWARIAGTYEISGLYQSAANDEASDLPWATAANIATSINAAIALMLADEKNPPYNLVLNAVEYADAGDFIANTAVTYRDWIRQTIGGDIFICNSLAAGDGLLLKADLGGMAEYVIAEDFSVETEIEDKRHGAGLFGRCYVRGLPVVYDGTAMCKLSAIESP